MITHDLLKITKKNWLNEFWDRLITLLPSLAFWYTNKDVNKIETESVRCFRDNEDAPRSNDADEADLFVDGDVANDDPSRRRSFNPSER